MSMNGLYNFLFSTFKIKSPAQHYTYEGLQ